MARPSPARRASGQLSEGSVLGGKPTGGGLFAGDHRSLRRRVYVAAGTVGPVAVKERFAARIVGVGEGVTAMKRVPPTVGVAGGPHFPEPARFRFGAGPYVLVAVERSPGPARVLPAHRSHVRIHERIGRVRPEGCLHYMAGVRADVSGRG